MKGKKVILGIVGGGLVLCGICAIALIVIANLTPPAPTVKVSLTPTLLKYGTETKIELTVSNPSKGSVLENYTALINITAKDSSSARTIKEIAIKKLPAGEDFQTTVTWLIDGLPTVGKEFQMEALLIDAKKIVQAKTTPLAFTYDFSVLTPTAIPAKPKLSIIVTPQTISSGITANVRVEAYIPPNGKACLNCFLSVVYRPVGERGGIEVAKTSVDLELDKQITKEFTWRVSATPLNKDYELAVAIMGPNNSFFSDEVATPIKFSKPDITLTITPTILAQNITASIKVKATNNGTTDWQSYKLIIGYSRENESNLTQAAVVNLTLGAGKTFEQDVPWKIGNTPTVGKYRLRTMLLDAGNVILGETEIPIEFK